MVSRTERGWAGHYICSPFCLFRRNTLLEKDGVFVVVSTVGNLYIDNKIELIGGNAFYETMAFYSRKDDIRFHDADMHRPVSFKAPWKIYEKNADDRANDMHETVVTELMNKMEKEF